MDKLKKNEMSRLEFITNICYTFYLYKIKLKKKN